jgi:penicillin-binding protein 1A
LREWRVALDQFQQKFMVPLYGNQVLAVVLRTTPTKAEIGVNSAQLRGTIPLSEVTWARKKITDNRRGAEIRSVAQVLQVGDVVLAEPVKKGASTFRLLQIPEVNGAMVVMDPHQGKVLAMTGGYSYAGSEFNRATQARRQPGSALKPFVYATALENGFSPTSIILDAPIELPQGPGMPLWRPKNYGGTFLGPTTLRTGLEKSRNAMTVRLAQYIGLGRVKRMAERFGIYDEETPTNFSMVLGSMETTLLRITNAYSMMVNGGKRVEPWMIERIDDRNGTTIFRRDTRLCYGCNVNAQGELVAEPPTIPDDREQIIDPRVAYQFVSLLEGAAKRGTGARTNRLQRPVGGKTGTTNESRDTWFIGFTPDYVVGTYIGFDTPRPMGAKETGGSVPIEAFIHFVEHALKDVPKHAFNEPKGVRNIPVNRITGQPLYEGEKVNKKDVIDEAFLVGEPIYKPAYELEAERNDSSISDNMSQEFPEGFYGGEGVDPYAPVDLGVPLYGEEGLVPPPGEVAPYQRPIENPDEMEGFNINSDAQTGTGGYY